MEWHEIIKLSTANIIVGKKGSGKSCLAYWLTDTISQKQNLLPIIVGFPREKQYLLPEGYAIKELDEALGTENAILLIDEGTTTLPAGGKLDELVKSMSALSRQRNQIIILIFHASRDIGSKILRGIDAIIIKEPSHRQIEFGSKNDWFQNLLIKAKAELSKLDERRKFAYVDSEDPEFRGIMENPKPSFWSEELSKAWAGLEVSSMTVKPRYTGLERKEPRGIYTDSDKPGFFPVKGVGSPGGDWELVNTYDFKHRTSYIYRNKKTGEEKAISVLK